MTTDEITIFVDTNILMHFRRINEIDWPALAKARRCRLLIAPVVMRELEEQKVDNRSSIIRSRIAEVVKQLHAWAEVQSPIDLRPATTLDFVDHDATIDFAGQRLNHRIHDDELIGSALQHREETDETVAIAANDSGIAVKLRSRPLRVIRLPDELRLSDQPDPRDQELKELRTELARMRTSKPKLQLRFVDDSKLWRIAPRMRPADDLLDPAALRLKHPRAVELEVDPVAERFRPLDLPAEVSQALSQLRAARKYNAALEDFYGKYEVYRTEFERWSDTLCRTHLVRLALINDGSMTASDVEITAQFTPGTKLTKRRDFPDPPKAPAPPPPIGTTRLIDPIRRFSDPLGFHPFDTDHFDGKVYLDRDASVATFSLATLKQGCRLNLQEFHLVMPRAEEAAVIQIEARTSLNEGPPVADTLVVQIE